MLNVSTEQSYLTVSIKWNTKNSMVTGTGQFIECRSTVDGYYQLVQNITEVCIKNARNDHCFIFNDKK